MSFFPAIISLLNKIINIRHSGTRSESERVRLRMLNIISLISCMFTWTYAILHFYMGKFYPSAVTFSLGIVFLFIIYLNHQSHKTFAKILHTINANIGIYSFSCFMGIESGVHLYILLAPTFVLSLFALSEKRLIVFCIGIYVVNYWAMMYMPSPSFFERIEMPYYLTIMFYHINIFFTLIMLGSIMVFVLRLNNNYIKEILHQNETLTNNQILLKEEIQKRNESEANLQKLFDELTRSYQHLEQFSFVVSHNLRAPLANILGFSSLYEPNEDGSKTNHKLVDNIHESAKNLDEILTDLNFILKSKSSILEDRKEISVAELVKNAIKALQPDIDKNHILVHYHFSSEQTILTSKAVIQSVLFNLVSNAIKYRKPEGQTEITISFSNDGNKNTIIVQDNGIGINLDKYSDRIFKLYNRFHTHVQGKGIGLYLVKTHIESLGGTIEIQSSPNVGTKFTISL